MSAGNAGAAIGLANTSKQAVIGALVADTVEPTVGVSNYIGQGVNTYYNNNVLGEDYATAAYQVASCNSPKNLQWVTNTASLTVPADKRVAVSAGGVATAASGSGAFVAVGFAASTVIPANSFFWVESFA